MASPGVVFLQRLADGSGALAPQERAIRLPAGWTVIDHPTDSLAGSADGPGQITGYVELVPPSAPELDGVTFNLAPAPTTVLGITGLESDPLLTWDGAGGFTFNPAGEYNLRLSGSGSGQTVLLGGLGGYGNGVQLASAAGVAFTANATGWALGSATPIASPARIGQLTDGSGGTASATIATIADSATANAVASLAAKLNALELNGHNRGMTQ